MLNYGARLEHVRAKQLVTCLYLYHDNRRSSKGFYSNSLYGEAYHQMFMLQIKEQMQILNGNNFFENEIDLVGNFRGRDNETDIA